MEEKNVYYGVDAAGETVEHGGVTAAGALAVVDERFAALKESYGSAEEALAATLFGFSRSADTFIEICLNGRDDISFKFEFPLPRRLLVFGGVSSTELRLRSKDELCALVSLFFASPAAAYKDRLEAFRGGA